MEFDSKYFGADGQVLTPLKAGQSVQVVDGVLTVVGAPKKGRPAKATTAAPAATKKVAKKAVKKPAANVQVVEIANADLNKFNAKPGSGSYVPRPMTFITGDGSSSEKVRPEDKKFDAELKKVVAKRQRSSRPTVPMVTKRCTRCGRDETIPGSLAELTGQFYTCNSCIAR